MPRRPASHRAGRAPRRRAAARERSPSAAEALRARRRPPAPASPRSPAPRSPRSPAGGLPPTRASRRRCASPRRRAPPRRGRRARRAAAAVSPTRTCVVTIQPRTSAESACSRGSTACILSRGAELLQRLLVPALSEPQEPAGVVQDGLRSRAPRPAVADARPGPAILGPRRSGRARSA